MRKAALSVLIVFMLFQPIIGLTNSPGMIDTFENPATISQVADDSGTRLSPEEHTSHVPILIDQPSDWSSQGWPGAGTIASPYIIEGLNITYDASVACIEITDVDSYFVIRDCFLYQQSAQPAIRLINTTHATVEYLTIISDNSGIHNTNANNTNISNCDFETNHRSIYMQSSVDCVIADNRVFSETHRAITADYCNGLTINRSVTITQAAMWFNVRIDHSDSILISECKVYDGRYAIYLGNCENAAVLNSVLVPDSEFGFVAQFCPNLLLDGCIVKGASSGGMYIDNCFQSEIRYCDITSSNLYGLFLESSNYSVIAYNDIHDILTNGIIVNNSNETEIMNNSIENTTQSALQLVNAEDALVANNTFHLGSESGIIVDASNGTHIEDNAISDFLLQGIDIANTSNANIFENNIAQISQTGILLDSSSNGNIVRNTISEVLEGIHLISSDFTSISENTIEEVSNRAIKLAGTDNSVINDCYITDVEDGIYASFCNYMEIQNNTIIEVTDRPCDLFLCDNVDISDNEIREAEESITLLAIQNATVTNNLIIDSLKYTTFLLSVQNLVFSDNELVGPSDYGCYFGHIQNGTFTNNVFNNTGFNFGGGGILDHYVHTFSSNTINGLPFHYVVNQLGGGSIDGTSFGQIFIVNSSGWTINGGIFDTVGVPIMVYYSNDTQISNVQSMSNIYGIKSYHCYDIEISNCSIQDNPHWRGIIISEVIDFEISELTAMNLPDGYAILVDVSSNGTISGGSITDCELGITVSQSTNVTVDSFDIRNATTYGIQSSESSHIFICNVVIENATRGIFFSNSNNGSITNNEVRYCTEAGIHILGTDDGNVTLNIAESNEYGLYVFNSEDWTATNNTLRWNYQYGLYLMDITTIVVSYNEIYLNFVGDGYDNGNRFWDDGVDTGNWWYPFDGTAPYDDIVGGTSEDRYPMIFMVDQPIINSPENVYYAEFSTGNVLRFHPHDNELRDWEVTIDGKVWDSGVWEYDVIEISIDGLSYGVHTFVITVWDVDQNSVNDTVLIHVFDDIDPIISDTPNTIAFEDGTGQELSWEVQDLHPSEYTVFLDGEEYETGSWTSGTLSVNIDGLVEGEYLFVIEIRDLDGNLASDSVRVRVIDDDISPTIDSPDDLIFIYGTEGNHISWSPDDEYPASYQVEWNGTIVKSGPWGGGKIILNVDDFMPGEYQLTLTVYDGSGRTASDSVNVTVLSFGETTPLLDWVFLLIIGAGVGGVIIIITAVLYYRKKKAT
ncbi:MAG: exported protein of unknown function [Candidatus Thorarchaeota archaeon]|nr:MAG: exported protein of unknown function [Candidatus Thorarchaeota archaeon]